MKWNNNARYYKSTIKITHSRIRIRIHTHTKGEEENNTHQSNKIDYILLWNLYTRTHTFARTLVTHSCINSPEEKKIWEKRNGKKKWKQNSILLSNLLCCGLRHSKFTPLFRSMCVSGIVSLSFLFPSFTSYFTLDFPFRINFFTFEFNPLNSLICRKYSNFFYRSNDNTSKFLMKKNFLLVVFVFTLCWFNVLFHKILWFDKNARLKCSLLLLPQNTRTMFTSCCNKQMNKRKNKIENNKIE